MQLLKKLPKLPEKRVICGIYCFLACMISIMGIPFITGFVLAPNNEIYVEKKCGNLTMDAYDACVKEYTINIMAMYFVFAIMNFVGTMVMTNNCKDLFEKDSVYDDNNKEKKRTLLAVYSTVGYILMIMYVIFSHYASDINFDIFVYYVTGFPILTCFCLYVVVEAASYVFVVIVCRRWSENKKESHDIIV